MPSRAAAQAVVMAAVWTASAALEPAPPLAPGVAAALDDDASLADCTRWHTRADGSRQAETVFALQGIYCAACAGVIEAAVNAVPGVDRAEVNAASRRLKVNWDPQRARASALVDAVHRAGYRALPTQREDARRGAGASNNSACGPRDPNTGVCSCDRVRGTIFVVGVVSRPRARYHQHARQSAWP